MTKQITQKTTLLLVLGLLLSSIVHSQDLHFTNYHYSPLYLSPAKTGAYAGTFRFGANVRDQFSSFIVEPYQTLMAYADMPIAFGSKSNHWVGAGINVFADKAGDLNFQNNGAHLSLAYHYAIDPKYKTILTIGLQFGMIQRNINGDKYNSMEILSGNLGDPDRNLLDNFNPTISDLNLGIGFKKWTSKKAYVDLGVSAYHILQSKYSFNSSSTQNPVSLRINAYAGCHVQHNKRLAFKPLIIYSRMIRFQNISGQLNLEYNLNKKSGTLLKGGLGYRSGDAIQFLAGIIYKGWDLGIAYDLTVSTAAEFTNSYGGLEFGLRKIIITSKKPKINPVLICPTL